jgi:hypothetical protein
VSMLRVSLAVSLMEMAALAASNSTAQTSDPELVKRLLDRVEQLERRVAELEATRTAPAPPSGGGGPAPTAQTHAAAPPPVESGPASLRPALQISGFSDFNFAASDNSRTHSGFSEGQFVLHFTSQLSQKVSYFGEVSVSARADGGIGAPGLPDFNFAVERSIIRYDVNDRFKISFGRYHTPINYWNTAFHHGAWLQTTVSRPEMTQFGGSFIPVHFIGSLVEGTAPAGGLNLTYNAGVGNGRASDISHGGDFGDVNNNRAWLVNGAVRPDAIYGLQVGGAVYHDKLNPAGLPAAAEWIQSAHIVWDKESPEVIAEFANVTHHPVAGGVGSNSQAWYVQTAYRLAPIARKLKPYYRYEYIHVPKSDAVFHAVPGLSGSVGGVRYDLTDFSALKFEYRRFQRPDVPAVNAFVGQTSFTF